MQQNWWQKIPTCGLPNPLLCSPPRIGGNAPHLFVAPIFHVGGSTATGERWCINQFHWTGREEAPNKSYMNHAEASIESLLWREVGKPETPWKCWIFQYPHQSKGLDAVWIDVSSLFSNFWYVFDGSEFRSSFAVKKKSKDGMSVNKPNQESWAVIEGWSLML